VLSNTDGAAWPVMAELNRRTSPESPSLNTQRRRGDNQLAARSRAERDRGAEPGTTRLVA
jgi:hypothetical protein